MINLELRNVLEYGIIPAYEAFKELHENLSYSDTSDFPETPRQPLIKNIKEFDEFLKKSNIFFIVLKEEQERIVGYIILDVFNSSGEAKIQEMMVTKKERRRGIGRVAVKSLIDELKEDDTINCVRIFSATMATDNFWSACNFRYLSGDTYEYKFT